MAFAVCLSPLSGQWFKGWAERLGTQAASGQQGEPTSRSGETPPRGALAPLPGPGLEQGNQPWGGAGGGWETRVHERMGALASHSDTAGLLTSRAPIF